MFKQRLNLQCTLVVLFSWFLPVRLTMCTYSTDATKTFVFDNFYHLQQNNASFPDNNAIKFKESYIPTVWKNSFVTHSSENIQKISLNGKKIQTIQDGAFYQLDCVYTLDLSNNSIANINKETFTGAASLRVLFLNHNQLEEIPDEAFTFLSRLRILTLANNKLQILTKNSFFKLWLLQYLNLSNNLLKSVNGETFQYFKSLNYLQLASNRIDNLYLENWKSGDSLVFLNVSDNALRRFNLSSTYSFQLSLRQLYLNNNYLTSLYVTHLRNRLIYLSLIDINDNFWTCSELLRLLKNFQAMHIDVYPGNAKDQPHINSIACDRPKVFKWNDTLESNVVEEIGERQMSPIYMVFTGFFLTACSCFFVMIGMTTRCFRCLRRPSVHSHVGYSVLSDGQ